MKTILIMISAVMFLSLNVLAATMTVSTLAELKQAVDNSIASDTIQISGTINIDENDFELLPIVVNTNRLSIEGVNNASINLLDDYGYENSQANFTSVVLRDGKEHNFVDKGYPPVFLVTQYGVSFDNLKIKGSTCQQCMWEPRHDYMAAIVAFWGWANNLSVTNSEFSDFYHAIVVAGAKNVTISNNNIHDNNLETYKALGGKGGDGAGYGIALYGNGEVEASDNTFSNNRHNIAADGSVGQKYHAIGNTISGYAYSHSFDVHSRGEDSTNRTQKLPAGYEFVIEDNTWINMLDTHEEALLVRGVPDGTILVKNNNFGCLEGSFVNQWYNDLNATAINPMEKIALVNNVANVNGDCTKPDPISSPVVSLTDNFDDIKVSWTASTGATYYLVSIKYENNNWTPFSYHTNTNFIAWSNLSAGARSYKVKACNSKGCSAESSVSNIMNIQSMYNINNMSAPTPQVLAGGRDIKLSWNSYKQVSYYDISIKYNNNNWTSWGRFKKFGETSDSITWFNIGSGTRSYKIRACDSQGQCTTSSTSSISITN